MKSHELQDLLGDMREQVLAELARNGTRKDVWRVIAEHRGYQLRLAQAVGSLLRKRGETAALADDLASEATVILTYKFRSEEPFPWKPSGNFTHWLGRVLVNACRDAWKRVAKHRHVEHQVSPDDWEGIVASHSIAVSENHNKLARIIEAITSMEEPCRTLLYEGLLRGVRQQEIAVMLNRSPSSISDAKKRCIAVLRTFLGIDRESES